MGMMMMMIMMMMLMMIRIRIIIIIIIHLRLLSPGDKGCKLLWNVDHTSPINTAKSQELYPSIVDSPREK
jgi:hypothetical protein